MYLKDYSENIDDFIEFLIGLTTATKLEGLKKLLLKNCRKMMK